MRQDIPAESHQKLFCTFQRLEGAIISVHLSIRSRGKHYNSRTDDPIWTNLEDKVVLLSGTYPIENMSNWSERCPTLVEAQHRSERTIYNEANNIFFTLAAIRWASALLMTYFRRQTNVGKHYINPGVIFLTSFLWTKLHKNPCQTAWEHATWIRLV